MSNYCSHLSRTVGPVVYSRYFACNWLQLFAVTKNWREKPRTLDLLLPTWIHLFILILCFTLITLSMQCFRFYYCLSKTSILKDWVQIWLRQASIILSWPPLESPVHSEQNALSTIRSDHEIPGRSNYFCVLGKYPISKLPNSSRKKRPYAELIWSFHISICCRFWIPL